MPQANKMGMNKTGMAMSPKLGKQMVKGAKELTQTGPVSYVAMEKIRSEYASADDFIGTVPLPDTFKGMLSTGKEKMKGHNPEVLINKLGQRLAFERTGVRIYDALIFKCEVINHSLVNEVISIDSLKRFRDEETEHFLLLKETIESLGADPTAMTPDADVSAVASMGIPKVLLEPRTTVLQCLEAVQTAELTDNAAWEVLVNLCEHMGMTEIAESFSKPLKQEKKHIETIENWINKLVLMQSGTM